MLFRESRVHTTDTKKEFEGRIRAFLASREGRDEVESAIIVDLLMAAPDEEPEKVYERAMDIWEHQRSRAPDVSIRDSGSSADVELCAPDGRGVTMRVIQCARGLVVRSSRGTKPERIECEKSWKERCFSGSFLRKVAKRRGACH